MHSHPFKSAAFKKVLRQAGEGSGFSGISLGAA